MNRFVAEPALAPLKDFQRATAEHVFSRLYRDSDPAKRFLIADEVGLGKTLVARGVIARTIEHLQDVVERVDIIYVCSNALIARQNLQRLQVDAQGHFELAERITMLPAKAHELAKNKVNMISFTPGTSFELTAGSGKARERALLRLMLLQAWGQERFRSRGSMRVFQGGVQKLQRFEQTYRDIAHSHWRRLDSTLVESFVRLVNEHDAAAVKLGKPTLLERFDELCGIFGHGRSVSGWPKSERRKCNQFIGQMRDLLARACLDALRPDLIILDEFQRFKHLLAAPGSELASEASELARELFEHVDHASGSQARVLLLSATPYKMFTTAEETDDDHHEDLVHTIDFLLEHDAAAVDSLRANLRALRRGLLQAGQDGGAAAATARDLVQTTLRRVMVRTERLSATPDRSGMLVSRPCHGLSLSDAEVGAFVASAQLARQLRAPDTVEYWKSAPYIVNFMDRYVLGKRLDDIAETDSRRLVPFVEAAERLSFEQIHAFEPIPIEHSRMRWLIDDTIGRGTWQLLWIPPSLPYLEPTGPFANPSLFNFTKRLVFSSWAMVPTAISTILTYEAERRMVRADGRVRYSNTPEGRQRMSRLLEFSLSEDRLSGMPVFALMYPAVVLAELGDPLALTREHGGRPIAPERAVELVAGRLQRPLDELNRMRRPDTGAQSLGEPTQSPGADERWYWAAPLWLDRMQAPEQFSDYLGDVDTLHAAFTTDEHGDAGDAGSRFAEHLALARAAVLHEDAPQLGRMPGDLAEVLATIALAGYGVCALRALTRATGRLPTDIDMRYAASRVAWGVRSLFNNTDITEVIHYLYPGERYWQRTLDYTMAGNLQSVFDEYIHSLIGSRGHLDPNSLEALWDTAHVLHNTVSLRTVRYGVKRVEVEDDLVSITPDRLRANFALRLADERNEDGTATRRSQVREAFNSPFRPFVLATTSVGQEGLDFHPYCHAVVHWNLPGNPVDLEQREGRVHRYHGHAVRRNIAKHYTECGLAADGSPWHAMFSAAERDRPAGQNDIVPHWIYTDDQSNAVERYIPSLPLSRDRSRAEALQKAVASYRLAFGQPRQEDLIVYLSGEVDSDDLASIAEELKIDLGPGEAGTNAGLSL